MPQGWRLDLAGIDPAEHWATMLGVAKAADEGPFDSIWVYDHFHTVPLPTQEATHEAWTLMAAYAASTSRVKLGQMCTCMGYRNPAYLAKVAATVDVISGGRAQMGIGAGWYEHEWRAYGYGFPGAGERIAMLDEGVQIMRQLWTTGTATLDGKHYQVDGAIARPLPLQDGGVRSGSPAAARRRPSASPPSTPSTPTSTAAPTPSTASRRSCEAHCREVGTDYGAIVRSANYNVVIGETEKEVQDRLAWIRAHLGKYLPAENADARSATSPDGPLVGTPEQIAEKLSQFRQLGMTYAITNFLDVAYDRSGLDLFAEKVAPALASPTSRPRRGPPPANANPPGHGSGTSSPRSVPAWRVPWDLCLSNRSSLSSSRYCRWSASRCSMSGAR